MIHSRYPDTQKLKPTRGVFVSNTKKEFPEIAAYLEKAEQKKTAGR